MNPTIALASIVSDADLAIDELTFEDDPVDDAIRLLERIRATAKEAMA